MYVDKKTYDELKKGGFMQQRQENYFSMRLKAVGGYVTTKQMDAIKLAADQFGHGYIHLTSRQGIEIPFIHINDIEAAKKFLQDNGVDIGVCGPRVRTITACQGSQICRSGLIDTAKIANAFDKRYGGRDLPNKFKFGFAGCSNNCVRVQENDIGVKGGLIPQWNAERCIFCGGCAKVCKANAITVDRASKTWTVDMDKCVNCGKCVKRCNAALSGEVGFIVLLGGQYTLPIIFGEDELFKVVDISLEFFIQNTKRGERFKATLERVGFENFTDYLRQNRNAQ